MKDESKPLSYWLNLTIYSSDGDGQYKVIRSTFDNGLIDPHNFIVILEDNERNVFWQTKKMPISNIDLLMGYLQGPSKFYQKAMESRLRRKYL